RTTRPELRYGQGGYTIVDLFSGCGGMSAGVVSALHDMGHGVQISLAVDQDPHAVAVLQRNFPTAPALQADVADYFDGDLNGRITPKERETRRLVPEAP